MEVTPAEEEAMIKYLAEQIHKYGMETVAILSLESLKPLVWVGGELGRAFITPFVPIISETWGQKTEKFFRIFEKRDNIDKLLNLVEKLAQGEEDDKKPKEGKEEGSPAQAEKQAEEPIVEPKVEQPDEDKRREGWRRFLPF
jgi:ATP-dependent RNA circularization protein (DNA/RNA ligase family)